MGGKEGFLRHHPSHPSSDKPKVIDASLILKHPHRSSRPDHVVVILRGLPGSAKSYLAKKLCDLEVENGGNAPRIHSMDDYFMTEVEKVGESESSGSARGKKPVVKKVMEYCYEPEMEERSGYEVYVLEATYKDLEGCAARNVHGFTLTDIQKMANQWEETPSLYMKLDIKSVLHGDDLEENGIEEVGRIGFSIGAGKATNVSLVIGPGSGFNSRSNPLPDEEKLAQRSREPRRRRNIFQEQLRAKHESFKAIFYKRKHRINELHLDDE